MAFHWSILANLSHAVVWIVSACPPISCTYSSLKKAFGDRSERTNYNRYHCHFHDPLSLLCFFLFFTLWSAGTAKSTILQVLIFLLIITRSGFLAWIKGCVCISKYQRILCITFTRIDSGLCIYHLVVLSNFNALHNSLWINLFTQACLVLYFVCTSLLHSLIVWLIVSSLSPHNLHLLLICGLSIFALT